MQLIKNRRRNNNILLILQMNHVDYIDIISVSIILGIAAVLIKLKLPLISSSSLNEDGGNRAIYSSSIQQVVTCFLHDGEVC